MIAEANRAVERGWLAERSNIVLQQAVRDADAAQRSFLDSFSRGRAGKRVGAPRLTSREETRQAIRLHPGGSSIRDNGKLLSARTGGVRAGWSWELPSAPSSVTAVEMVDERHFASFAVESGDDTSPAATDEPGQDVEIGIDLGSSAFAVDHHGRAVENPRGRRRAERQSERAQRELSRKQKGSKNRAKARKELARPRPQCLEDHPRRRAGGETKRPWGRRKTPCRGGWR